MKSRAASWLVGAALAAACAPRLSAAEPAWREPWQRELTAWLKSLDAKDVAVEPKVFDWSRLDPAELHRNMQLINGGYPPLGIATTALRIPARDFLWKEGLWREDGESQTVLKPYGLERGQMWIPSGPTTADSLAWLYSWNRPWNPYHGDRAVAWRAAIISMVDLIMIREGIHYYTSGEEGCRQPPFGARACESGFSLTFNAFAFLQVRDALPEPARKAWGEGLRWYAQYNVTSPPGGPENMQLSVPVGIYYAGLALGDDALKQKAEALMNRLLDKNFRRAGYLSDAGVPDGSYNGISLHRLAEYWAISHSPRVLDALRAAYDLKASLTLPEPDGSTLSPSHFNARCKDGFDNDQYQGREVMFLKEIPTAGLFAKKSWLSAPDETALVQRLEATVSRNNPRVQQPQPWESNHRWDGVLSLPYVVHHEKDEAAMDAIVHDHLRAPVEMSDRFTKNFGNEFFVVRRPAYAAIFYAGPAVASDDGATNHAGMLNREGGYMMGFGGGGLSAFWTPQAGSLLLGRLTALEGYDRKTKSLQWGDYLISGWRDWLTNQIVGETIEGKILTSGRAESPRSRLAEDGSKLEIRGKIPRKSRRQGDITDADLAYHRTYTFDDAGVDCALEIQTDKPLTLKSLYESLPVLTGQMNLDRNATEASGPTTWQFLGADGKPLTPSGDRVEGVREVTLTRFDGGGAISFEQPVTISLTSVEAVSSQVSKTTGRALLIELPTTLEPGAPLRLKYRLTPHTVGQKMTKVFSNKHQTNPMP